MNSSDPTQSDHNSGPGGGWPPSPPEGSLSQNQPPAKRSWTARHNAVVAATAMPSACGGEDGPSIDTIELDGGQYQQNEGIAQTKNQSSKLTAAITDVETH